jgi:hypothetical protein
MPPSTRQSLRRSQLERRTPSRRTELLQQLRRDRIRRRSREAAAGTYPHVSEVIFILSRAFCYAAARQPASTSSPPPLTQPPAPPASPTPSSPSSPGWATPTGDIPNFPPWVMTPSVVPGGDPHHLWVLKTPFTLCAYWEKVWSLQLIHSVIWLNHYFTAVR